MSAAINEVGNKYSRLTVISRAGSNGRPGAYWLCLCECGNKVVVQGVRLRNGTTRSCGCLRLKRDEAGNRYGRLTVLEYAGHGHWLCQCDCGSKTTVSGKSLRRGATRSCGCLAREIREMRTLPEGEAALNALIYRYKHDARRRGISWELAKEQCRGVFSRPCHYCGLEPAQIKTSKNGVFLYNGIDRFDNTLGYTKENCVACCWYCNQAKSDMSIGEFKAWLTRAYKQTIIRGGKE